MKTPFLIFCLIVVLNAGFAQHRILVFSKTTGYRHASIGAGKLALMVLGRANKIEMDTTERAHVFTKQNLAGYDAVIFLSTTGDVLNSPQEAAFQEYIENGGGFVGIHAAADTEYDWPWYGQLVGAYFKSHPKIQGARLVRAKAFGSAQLPDVWTRTDEWYNYRYVSEGLDVLYNLDESSYNGGENGTVHPISWLNYMKNGRVFYTGMGHTSESFSEPGFLAHLLDGIEFVLKTTKTKIK